MYVPPPTPIVVVPYDPAWPSIAAALAGALRSALVHADPPIPAEIEHVGSTSVPGLAAKPLIDMDIIVSRPDAPRAIAALVAAGYQHKGNLGLEDRDAIAPADGLDVFPDGMTANIYVCVQGTLHLRNHLAVRKVLRERDDLRDEYAAVKLALAAQEDVDIDRYLAGKTPVLQKVLDLSDLTDEEKARIRRFNDPSQQ